MKFLIDMATPKQVNFFRHFYYELLKRGHEVTLVSRYLYETSALLDYYGLPAITVGRQSIGSKEEKLMFGLNRMSELYRIFVGFKPDALITLCNPESSHIAYRLGVPIYCFCDMPESTHASKLTLSLAKTVFTPFFAFEEHSDSFLNKLGTVDIVEYNAFDQCLYMPKQPDKQALKDYGLTESDIHNFIMFREGDNKASYYSNPTRLIQEIAYKLSDHKQVYLPHYGVHKIGDLQSLLAYPTCLVGGGGTVNIESVWWDVPTVSTRPIVTCYDRWLIKNGLMYRVKTVEEGEELVRKIIEDRSKYQPDGSKIRNMKFPLAELIDIMEEST